MNQGISINLIPFILTQTTPSCLKDVLEQLLDAVVSYTEPTGRLVSELFQKLPSKMVHGTPTIHMLGVFTLI